MNEGLRRARTVVIGVSVIALAVAGVGLSTGWDGRADDLGEPAHDLGEPAHDLALEPRRLDGEAAQCGAAGTEGVLTFSAPSGFYDEPFELEMEAPASAHPIRFTLDGSSPSLEAAPASTKTYSVPLRVDGSLRASPPISAWRTRVDQAAAREGQPGSPMWDLRPPDGQTATVVRARTSTGHECVGVFFVGQELVRHDLGVLHLTTDPAHLFDHDTGIAVPGMTFDDYAASGEFDPEEAPRRMPGNFTNTGREWERPSEDDLARPLVLHYFEPGGLMAYETRLGVRIHGGVTRERPQKSLRLYARNDYGDDAFRYPFFGDAGPDEHRRLILRNSGNDWNRTQLLDGYIQDVVADLGIDTQAYEPTVTFINGEYWGILNLRERYDRHYLGITHGVDAGNVAIVEGDLTVGTGRESDVEDLRRLLEFVARRDLSDPANYAEVEAHLDVGDLIDHLVVQIFISNTDWPGANVKLWRERVESADALGVRDGRWRWLLYDLDHVGAHRLDPSHDQLERLAAEAHDPTRWTGIPSLLTNLLDAPEFRARFEARFDELLDTTFHPDRTVPMLHERAQRIEAEMPLHFERWASGSMARWNSMIEDLEHFMRERPAVQRAQLETFLQGWPPEG